MANPIRLPLVDWPQPKEKLREAMVAHGVEAIAVAANDECLLLNAAQIDALEEPLPETLDALAERLLAIAPVPQVAVAGAVEDWFEMWPGSGGMVSGTMVTAPITVPRSEVMVDSFRRPVNLMVCSGPRRHVFDAGQRYTSCPYDGTDLYDA